LTRPPLADRLADAAGERRSQLCLGLDPVAESGDAAAEECERLIREAGRACVAVKPQLACFERLGTRGWAALERVVGAAREAGLLVVADAKRGDVPHTAAAYAQALIGPGGLEADAVTVNPLLGADSLEPWVDAAATAGAGLFVLVRTSNPGAADVLDLPVDGVPLHERLAALVAAERRLDGEGGLSGMGAVVGATAPELLGRLRSLMPSSILLLPGVGAQGASPADLAPAIGAHPASILVPVSRGISAAADPGEAAERLRGELWSLRADSA
jgi:orotidine-5'-phosphate decarboxylase